MTTVGSLVGLMFLGVWALFCFPFLVSAIVCSADPTDTFGGLPDMVFAGICALMLGMIGIVRFGVRAVRDEL